MNDRKPPHKTLTEKNNGLSSTQEVLYAEEFKKADKAARQENSQKPDK